MSKHLTPLEVVERLIAPRKILGSVLGYKDKAAYNWVNGSKWRQPGDMPPEANRRALQYAQQKAIPLTADHLIFGAKADEIDRLLERRKVAAE